MGPRPVPHHYQIARSERTAKQTQISQTQQGRHARTLHMEMRRVVIVRRQQNTDTAGHLGDDWHDQTSLPANS